MKRFLNLPNRNKIDWIQFVKLNFCNKSIKRMKGKFIYPYRGSNIKVSKKGTIILEADLFLNFSPLKGGRSYLFLEAGATLKVLRTFKVFYNCDVAVYSGATLTLGGGYMNAGSQLRCSQLITIGKGAAIARGVIVLDSDSHEIVSEDHVIDQPVIIGEHVWLGVRSTVLKGVKIEDGGIVAAEAVVTKDVMANTIVAGNPARCIRENVEWK